jgi:hypothetical protein
MQIARCGDFLAPCTSDSQCASDTCVSGSCDGVLSSSSSPSLSPSTITTPASSAATGIPLGEACDFSSQCTVQTELSAPAGTPCRSFAAETLSLLAPPILSVRSTPALMELATEISHPLPPLPVLPLPRLSRLQFLHWQ